MKNIIGAIVWLLAIIPIAKADYVDDVKVFGQVSGIGLACNAKYYPAYETIVRAYLLSAARSDEEQAQGMQVFNDAKVEAFLDKEDSDLLDCDELRDRFDSQVILKTKLYKDGTLKMPDGKIIRPRRSYDARLVYDRNSNEREWMEELYDTILEDQKKDAQEQGIYNKIRHVEMTGRY